MSGILAIVALVIGGLFALWAVSCAVYLVGTKATQLIEKYDRATNGAAIWGWGAVHSLTILFVLFLLVRFIKFSWTLD